MGKATKAACRRLTSEAAALADACGGRANALLCETMLGMLELSLGEAERAVAALEPVFRARTEQGLG